MTAPAGSGRASSRRARSQLGRPAAVRVRIGGGFAARSYRVRRASYGTAPPTSRLLRPAQARRPSAGLDPGASTVPPGRMRGQARGLPGRRATHTGTGCQLRLDSWLATRPRADTSLRPLGGPGRRASAHALSPPPISQAHSATGPDAASAVILDGPLSRSRPPRLGRSLRSRRFAMASPT